MQVLDPLSLQAQELLNTQYLRELAVPQDFDAETIACHLSQVVEIETSWLEHELSTIDRKTLPHTVKDFELWYRDCFRP